MSELLDKPSMYLMSVSNRNSGIYVEVTQAHEKYVMKKEKKRLHKNFLMNGRNLYGCIINLM